MIVVFDGTLEGLLTVVFDVYLNQYDPIAIHAIDNPPSDLFADLTEVATNQKQAARVRNKLIEKSAPSVLTHIEKVLAYELPTAYILAFKYIRKIIDKSTGFWRNYSDDTVMEVQKILKSIRREIHRIHAFVRFIEYEDNYYHALIEPDFDVLKWSYSHFVKRYPAMNWSIADVKRDKAVIYRKEDRHINWIIGLEQLEYHEQVEQFRHHSIYEEAWQKYFRSVNISERRNDKLHLQHVPKRYWKNLIEKQEIKKNKNG